MTATKHGNPRPARMLVSSVLSAGHGMHRIGYRAHTTTTASLRSLSLPYVHLNETDGNIPQVLEFMHVEFRAVVLSPHAQELRHASFHELAQRLPRSQTNAPVAHAPKSRPRMEDEGRDNLRHARGAHFFKHTPPLVPANEQRLRYHTRATFRG